MPSDFDGRPPGYEQQESETVVHPKPIPEAVDFIKKIIEDNPNDETLKAGKLAVSSCVAPTSSTSNIFGRFIVSHELAFVLGTLEYVASRLSSPSIVETSWKNRHLSSEGTMMVGSFMNLHCGHNNPFSDVERKRLKSLLLQSVTTSSSPTGN